MLWDTIIIGAGASGLMCALKAARRGKKILLIDHKQKFAQKLLVSGNGRCNFSNANMGAQHFESSNPHFVKSALARFAPSDLITFIKSHGIGVCEEDGGKYFLKGGSRLLLDAFIGDLKGCGVKFVTEDVLSISKKDFFSVDSSEESFKSSKLVIATGGLSYPKLGASDLGYRIAKQFGHKIVPCRPALVAFILSVADKKYFSGLSGISFNARVTLGERNFSGDCLITHQGLSGPAILRVSMYWEKGESITVDFLPDRDIKNDLVRIKRLKSQMQLKSYLSQFMPGRLAVLICNKYLKSCRVCELSEAQIGKFSRDIHGIKIVPAKTVGFEKADVTRGGVCVDYVSSKTMESQKCPGLYFIGEVLDVAGDLGGYNLHWAWASGAAAGGAI